MPDGSLAKLPLKRIIFGPMLRDDGTVAEVLDLMLEKYQFSGVEVESANIPYRL
jgi:hypothetical protein